MNPPFIKDMKHMIEYSKVNGLIYDFYRLDKYIIVLETYSMIQSELAAYCCNLKTRPLVRQRQLLLTHYQIHPHKDDQETARYYLLKNTYCLYLVHQDQAHSHDPKNKYDHSVGVKYQDIDRKSVV